MTGPVRDEVASMPDLRPRELWAVGPLIALIIVLGIYPRPVLNIINPAVHSTLIGTHSTDPVPPHPVTPVSPVTATGKSSAGKSAAGKSVVVSLKQGSSR
jgi:NADH-quinone oxidoreductase subunit M